jgi:ADP-heptose:LPS heptosyltransferase
MLNNLGDVLMTTPMIDSIKKNSKNSKIYFLVDYSCQKAILNLDLIEKVFVFNRFSIKKEILNNNNLENIKNSIKELILEINSLDLDELYNFYYNELGFLFSNLIYSKKKFGGFYNNSFKINFTDFYSKYLYFLPNLRSLNSFHICDVISNINNQNRLKKKILFNNNIDDNFFFKLNLDKNDFLVGIQISSAVITKRVINENLTKILNHFSCKFKKIKFIFFGVKNEKPFINEIFKKLNFKYIDLVSKTSIDELSSIIKNLNFLICTDTFTMHLAANYNIETISLFSSTNPIETGGYFKNCLIIQKMVSCKSCFFHLCNEMFCMKHFNLNDILTALKFKRYIKNKNFKKIEKLVKTLKQKQLQIFYPINSGKQLKFIPLNLSNENFENKINKNIYILHSFELELLKKINDLIINKLFLNLEIIINDNDKNQLLLFKNNFKKEYFQIFSVSNETIITIFNQFINIKNYVISGMNLLEELNNEIVLKKDQNRDKINSLIKKNSEIETFLFTENIINSFISNYFKFLHDYKKNSDIIKESFFIYKKIFYISNFYIDSLSFFFNITFFK